MTAKKKTAKKKAVSEQTANRRTPPADTKGKRDRNGRFLPGGQTPGRTFQPGESGNPGGRPKRKAIVDAIEAKLEEKIPNDAKGRTWETAIAERLLIAILGALSDPSRMRDGIDGVREILDRLIGKPAQSVALSSPDGSMTPAPMAREIVIADAVLRDAVATLREAGCNVNEGRDAPPMD